MMSTPGPQCLCKAPELAALALLDAALAVASNALLAVHGELHSGAVPDEGSPGLQAFAADALILHISGLQTALGRYCAAPGRCRKADRRSRLLNPRASPSSA